MYADQVKDYVNEDFYSALQAWQLTKMWGLANGNVGWANEPIEYIDSISILESEQNAMEAEEMGTATSKNKKMVDAKNPSAGKVSNLVKE